MGSAAAFLGFLSLALYLFFLAGVVFVLVMLWQIRTNTKNTSEKMDRILQALDDIKNKNT